MGPCECNHIQQRHASNRLEIDPEGEEEVIVNAGPLGAVRNGCPSVSPSLRQMQQGSHWVCAGWDYNRGEVIQSVETATTGGPRIH